MFNVKRGKRREGHEAGATAVLECPRPVAAMITLIPWRGLNPGLQTRDARVKERCSSALGHAAPDIERKTFPYIPTYLLRSEKIKVTVCFFYK